MFEKIAKIFRREPAADLNKFKQLFDRFQLILRGNNRVFELISELEDKLSGEYIFDINYLIHINDQLSETIYLIISNLNIIADNRFRALFARQTAIQEELNNIIQGRVVSLDTRHVIDNDDVDSGVTELVGGKNAKLGEIRNYLKMPTPDGFCLAVTAYNQFISANDIWAKMRAIRDKYNGDIEHNAKAFDRDVDDTFESSHFPPEIKKDINKQVSSLHKHLGEDTRLAIRSSAVGEDVLGRSYAGQFKSFLWQRPQDAESDIIKVIASRFKHRIAAYAAESFFDEADLLMSVGVQRMIAAHTAGVAYSLEPSGEFADSLAISACYGLGVGVVEGITNTDYFRVSRQDPTQITYRRIGKKDSQIVPDNDGGVKKVSLPESAQKQACISDNQIAELAGQVMVLERFFKRPVDVEWCYDEHGKLYIVQCRPLKFTPVPGEVVLSPARGSVTAPVLMKKRGQIAQRGIAAGKIFQVSDDVEASEFPGGAIAVTKYTTPRLTSIIRKAAAIITDIGSPSGHMATVAREFGVPMIVNTSDATSTLPDGIEVTVDAEENVIYKGIVKELLEYTAEGEDVFRDLREYKILRRLLRRIWPLFLIDPNSSDFTARNCRTYHDIVRFCHEKAVQILINLNISSQRFRGVETKKLKLPIPLGLNVIDLGRGLEPGIGGPVIEKLEKIRSRPMLAILKGMVSPGAWETQPVQLGFGDLVSSLTRFSMTDRAGQYRGQNLAVISNHYANISLRLGYHFNVIDTYVSENVDDNYIYFRFVGGVTGTERRHLRAILIKEILEKLNFKVTLSGDLVVGRLKKWNEKEVLSVLEDIGRLIGFTRQLDTQMQSEQSVAEWFKVFFKQIS